MLDEYLIRDLPDIIPHVKAEGISSINELKFGMIIIRHPNGSYTEYYPNYGGVWRYHRSADDLYQSWMIPVYKDGERAAQFQWRLEYLIKSIYCLGQERFARELDISQGTISNYTWGKRKPDYDMLVKIADVVSSKNKICSTSDIISFLLSVYVDPYVQQEYDLYLSEHR